MRRREKLLILPTGDLLSREDLAVSKLKHYGINHKGFLIEAIKNYISGEFIPESEIGDVINNLAVDKYIDDKVYLLSPEEITYVVLQMTRLAILLIVLMDELLKGRRLPVKGFRWLHNDIILIME